MSKNDSKRFTRSNMALKGIGSVINIAGEPVFTRRSDSENIKRDFIAIGKDMKYALDRFHSEHKADE